MDVVTINYGDVFSIDCDWSPPETHHSLTEQSQTSRVDMLKYGDKFKLVKMKCISNAI